MIIFTTIYQKVSLPAIIKRFNMVIKLFLRVLPRFDVVVVIGVLWEREVLGSNSYVKEYRNDYQEKEFLYHASKC
jgi:hypothetical protein